jgi:hypothetical protein
MLIAISGLMGGIALGLRFKVFAVFLAVAAAGFMIGVTAIALNLWGWPTLWAMVEVTLTIQAGYLIGLSGADYAARTLSRVHSHVPSFPPISNLLD